MFPFDALSVVIAVAGCICASYADLKAGKVPNRIPWSMLVLSAGLAAFRHLSGEDFLGLYALNLILGFIIAIALWQIRAWSGGDAKVFWAVCALIPVHPGSGAYYSGYSFGMTVLFNLAMLLILKSYISALMLHIREKKTSELAKLVLRPLIYAFTSFMFSSAAANVSGIPEIAYSSLLIVFLLSYAERTYPKAFLPACALLLGAGYVFSGKIDLCGQKALISASFLASAYAASMKVPSSRLIPVSEARSGMSLSSDVKNERGDVIMRPRPWGLTDADMAALRGREKEFGGKISVGISFPLMPFMLAALLLSLYVDLFWLMFGR